MSSDSEVSNFSPNRGPVPTPGGGLDKSPSNSPEYNREENHTDRSRSASRSDRSGSRSRSNSVDSNKSGQATEKSSPRRSRSRSVASNKSSGSNKSGSRKSGSGNEGNRSRSHSGGSRSQSGGSNRSRSGSGSNRSRSKSAESNRSKSRSKSRSRSKSVDSGRSRSRSRSSGSNRSRSRSNSAASSRSGSSAGSNKERRSRSRSKSVESNRSRRSTSKENASGNESPAKQDDEGSDVEKDKSQSTEKARSKVIDTDSEPEPEQEIEKPAAEASAAALFGDADDISSEEEEDKQDDDDREERRRTDEEDNRSHHSEEERHEVPVIEDDEEKGDEPIPETRIDVEIPKISCDLGRDIHFVKLPNFLSVDTRPFDQETYEDEIDEEETLDEEGRARLKLKVENTIRWRETQTEEGILKESNARLVKWSDGSLSLHLGSEIFDVYKQPLQGDHNHLFIRQGTGLQGQAVFRTKLSFRPHSTESFTHRKMTLSLADRSQKTSGIKILSQVGVDPDQDRKTLLKKEEEKLRQTVRVKTPKKRGEGVRNTHNSSNVYREEEGSDEDGAISLNAIKNKYKSGAAIQNKGGAIYSSDEEGSDFETHRGRKQEKPKALKDSESSEESE